MTAEICEWRKFHSLRMAAEGGDLAVSDSYQHSTAVA